MMTKIRFYADGKYDEWEETQKLVDLAMMILMGIAFLTWGGNL